MNIAILVISLTGAVILLLRDWRFTVPALLLNYLSIAWFLAGQQFLRPDLALGPASLSTTIIVKVITGLAIAAILGITGPTFSREYNQDDLDEFSLAELRRAARRAQKIEAGQLFRMSDFVVPFWALVLAILASVVLPRIYPIGRSYAIDFAWYWLGFVGIFTMITANDLLKIGLGLMLCVASVDLLYTAVSSSVQVFPLALLSLMSIVLALGIAYLSGLLYGRLKTLDLGELYRK